METKRVNTMEKEMFVIGLYNNLRLMKNGKVLGEIELTGMRKNHNRKWDVVKILDTETFSVNGKKYNKSEWERVKTPTHFNELVTNNHFPSWEEVMITETKEEEEPFVIGLYNNLRLSKNGKVLGELTLFGANRWDEVEIIDAETFSVNGKKYNKSEWKRVKTPTHFNELVTGNYFPSWEEVLKA